jgi:hypothetical protein
MNTPKYFSRFLSISAFFDHFSIFLVHFGCPLAQNCPNSSISATPPDNFSKSLAHFCPKHAFQQLFCPFQQIFVQPGGTRKAILLLLGAPLALTKLVNLAGALAPAGWQNQENVYAFWCADA